MKKTVLKSFDYLRSLLPTPPSSVKKASRDNDEKVLEQAPSAKFDSQEPSSTPYSRFKAKRASKLQNIPPRLATLAIKYRIPSSDMVAYLKSKGFTSVNESSLLSLDEFNHVNMKFIAPKINQRPEFKKIKIDLEKCRVDKSSGDKTLLEYSFFELPSSRSDELSKVAEYISFPGLESFSSNFSDDQAIRICSKMSNSFVRSLCTKVNGTDGKKALYQIHYIANKALRLFGEKILTFIMNLRALEFSTNGSIEIVNFREVLPDFPLITVESDDGSFFISFFLQKDKKKNKLSSSVKLHSKEGGEVMGEIDENGIITARLQKFYPRIKLYCKILKDQSMQIFSGVETGKCEVCGHILTSSASCKIGIGPVCAEKLGLDQSLYNF
jgi:hypothetical protein